MNGKGQTAVDLGGKEAYSKIGSINGMSWMFTDHELAKQYSRSTSLRVAGSGGSRLAELRFKALRQALGRLWGETRYTYGSLRTKFQFTGQRNETADIGLYFYNARWYDSALGRFAQADTDVPESQGVQAWDRFAYVNNNSVKYDDPTGKDVGCGGRDASECKSVEPPKPPEPPHVDTNAIILSGGPGATQSYGAKVEDEWTGYSTSGESKNPGTAGAVNLPGLLNDPLVWLRDNTQFREKVIGPLTGGINTDVSGKVYYELAQNGWRLTGVSISNTSKETIKISSVSANIYSFYGNTKVDFERLYPYLNFSLQSANYGVAQAGYSSGIVRLTSDTILKWQYVDVSIFLRSQSGRWGDIGVRLSVNPNER